jgi:hypothetical protein
MAAGIVQMDEAVGGHGGSLGDCWVWMVLEWAQY